MTLASSKPAQEFEQAHNEHPTHVAFVRDRWANEVEDFSELDFVPL